MSDEVTNMAISVMDVQIGHHFSIKVIKKLMLSKNANKKNVLLIGIFRWKKNEKDSNDFDFKGQIVALFDTSPLHQFSKFNDFLWVCWFFKQKYF